ncbi:MAG: DUF1697 domain-containing protein [Eubacteriaceae bacterium]|nr:DUF1697 domain-containing protein [Eubacteriaceae bacterium]
MNTYIAFLRGINVGGKNKIKMDDLKSALESIGLCSVKTYIQSGNIIFSSPESEDMLIKLIKSEIKEKFDINTSVVIRTLFELEQIISNCPFSQEQIAASQEANSEGESFYVALLPSAPSDEKIDALNKYKNDNDNFNIINRDIYMLLRQSIRTSKLADKILKLDSSVTVRNFNTIKKIIEIAKS